MADQFVGHALASAGLVTSVDTVQRNMLGARIQASNGNEYVYLAGVASCAAGDFVTYNATTYVAVRLVSDAVGMVAIAPAAILAANWGWFLIKGFYSGASALTTGHVLNTAIGVFSVASSAAPGAVYDCSVAGDFVNGVVVITNTLAAGSTAVQISYPYVTNTVPA